MKRRSGRSIQQDHSQTERRTPLVDWVVAPLEYLKHFLYFGSSYYVLMALSGKVALILGATGTVGSGAAHAFLEEDANVILTARDKGKLDRLKRELLADTKVR